MAVWLSALLVAVSAAAGTEARALPTVLVMPLVPKGGVPQGLAGLVTDKLVDEAARRGSHRVISHREVEGTVSLEQQRQLVDCD